MRWFAREEVNIDKEVEEALKKMNEQLAQFGGKLTFVVEIDNEGWVAKCKEFDGIVTGGTSTNPREEEVMKSIIDSVKTAFHIPITPLEVKKHEEKSHVPSIKVIRERELQFC